MLAEIGDKITLKKAHACGGNGFEVIRVGADFKLKCLKCGKIILLDYNDLKRRLKSREEQNG